MEILAAALAGAIGGGLLVWLARVGAPLTVKLFGGVLAVRRELDADRDRIIDNLRDEIADYARRLGDEERNSERLERDLAAARGRIAVLEAVIDELAKRIGTSREALTRQVEERGST